MNQTQTQPGKTGGNQQQRRDEQNREGQSRGLGRDPALPATYPGDPVVPHIAQRDEDQPGKSKLVIQDP